MLTSLPSGRENYPATRISDVKALGLPDKLARALGATIHKERMYWEPFVECAEDYYSLAKLLAKRGYANVPRHFNPLHPLEMTSDAEPEILVQDAPKKKTMLRKKT